MRRASRKILLPDAEHKCESADNQISLHFCRINPKTELIGDGSWTVRDLTDLRGRKTVLVTPCDDEL
jgi:hypothetical protein